MPYFNSEFQVRIKNCQGPVKVLDYLSSRFTYRPTTWWVSAIEENRISVNGITTTLNGTIENGDQLCFGVKDHWEPDYESQPKMLHQAGGLTFIHKPSNIPIHKTGQIIFSTLVQLIRAQLKDNRLSPLNRLDRETSGIVVFAAHKEFRRRYSPTNLSTRWLKVYIAVIPASKHFFNHVIDLPLAEQEESAIRCQMHPSPSGKKSISVVHTLRVSGSYQIVAVVPITGRKHQVRAHLASMGVPILGDKIYSHGGTFYLKRLNKALSESDFKKLGSCFHLLHCFYCELSASEHNSQKAFDYSLGVHWQRFLDVSELREWAASYDFIKLRENALQMNKPG